MKKFLSKFGLPDVPTAVQFLDEEIKEEPKNSIADDILDEVKEQLKEGKEEEKEKKVQTEKEKEKSVVNIKCLWVEKLDVYSLQFLQNKKNDYEKEFDYGKIVFNFCQNTIKYQDSDEYKESTVIWEKGTENETDIIKIAGSIESDSKSNQNEWYSFMEDELDEKNRTKSGLKIKLTHGEKCDKNSNHQTYIKIYCDSDVPDDQFTSTIDLSDFDHDRCIHYINTRSIYGCPFNDWYLLKRLMNDYKIIFAIVFVALGLFFCAFGKKLEKVTIMLVFGVVVCFLVTLIVLNFLPSVINTEKRLWIVLGVGFVVGSFIGFFLRAKVTILAILLGASLGYSVAQFIFQFVQGIIDWKVEYVYWGTVGVCCLLGIGLGLLLLNFIVILGTSVLGGYIAMRGITFIFGNYIDESQLVDMIKNKEYDQLDELSNGWVFAYLGVWVFLSLFGVYYQCIGHKKSQGNNDYSKMKK